MSAVDRAQLLRAAARYDSDSSEGDGGAGHSDSSRSSDEQRRHHRSRSSSKKHSHDKKRKKSKHSSSKKAHKEKRQKRSDHEKIAELERRAAGASGAGSLLPSMHARRYNPLIAAAAAAGNTGDAVILDTDGDAQNALYESLYAGTVPRYRRLDPLRLVASTRLAVHQQEADASTGNRNADRQVGG